MRPFDSARRDLLKLSSVGLAAAAALPAFAAAPRKGAAPPTTPTFFLPGAQEQLLEAVYAANPKTVLVLMNAGPLAVNWANDHLPAILDGWYPGEAGGIAIARALFGDDNPGGHLPYTVYASLDGVPPPNEYDVSKGYTYMYFKGLPLYPFGYGLSYTRFEYSHLKLSAGSISPAGKVDVSFEVKNVGERAGADVAQLRISSTVP